MIFFLYLVIRKANGERVIVETVRPTPVFDKVTVKASYASFTRSAELNPGNVFNNFGNTGFYVKHAVDKLLVRFARGGNEQNDHILIVDVGKTRELIVQGSYRGGSSNCNNWGVVTLLFAEKDVSSLQPLAMNHDEEYYTYGVSCYNSVHFFIKTLARYVVVAERHNNVNPVLSFTIRST